eukprot:TRINITY_DN705_c0_g1_i2.p1 TRINITY_DN705_c0_g1~~TRINITY_DN705_c0_g1_i2.p1  ORF type:complete len:176 (+),score=33.38 TRINITY_DN705_c0_g1_i2:223-750(+)
MKKRIRELATQITLVEEDTTRTQKRLDRANYKASNSESSTTPTKWVTSSDSILSEIPLGNTQGGVVGMKKSLSEPHLPRSPSLDTSDSTGSITQTSESSTPHRNRRISSTRQSRIRLDSSGRRVLKGSLEKTLHLPAHYATKTNLTYRSNLESSQPVPEGYSDWEEVLLLYSSKS